MGQSRRAVGVQQEQSGFRLAYSSCKDDYLSHESPSPRADRGSDEDDRRSQLEGRSEVQLSGYRTALQVPC